MELLKNMIINKGTVNGKNILKVDSFLNHQIDVELLNEIGKEFKKLYRDNNITKILTIEASGIGIACIAAQYFNVPVVFAKKTESLNLDTETLESQVYSYTKQRNYTIKVSKKYIQSEDRVLIIDDFLAEGQAALGLINIVNQAGAKVEGVGIVIEKTFQTGGQFLRSKGIRVDSLAKVKSIENNQVIFE